MLKSVLDFGIVVEFNNKQMILREFARKNVLAKEVRAVY
jgi:putative heme iron utilization protein